MKLNLRQGVVQAPPTMLNQMGDGTVTIDTSAGVILATAAHRDKNYLINEHGTVDHAWGPFAWNGAWGAEPMQPSYHLYWDLNLVNGRISRGYTGASYSYGVNAPPTPSTDHHWFDLNINQMKVYTGSGWKQVIRVFAGTITPSIHLINQSPIGSQVNLSYPATIPSEVDAGYVLYDMVGAAVRLNDNTFMTTVEPVMTNHGSFSMPIKMELVSVALMALDNMLPYTCVAPYQGGLRTAGVTVDRLPIGLAGNNCFVGDPCELLTQGPIYHDQWNWDPMLPHLYCDPVGHLTQHLVTIPGAINTQMGLVLGPKTVLLGIR